MGKSGLSDAVISVYVKDIHKSTLCGIDDILEFCTAQGIDPVGFERAAVEGLCYLESPITISDIVIGETGYVYKQY